MKILTFTTLYPNAVQPQHGVFVENRLRHLLAGGQVSARVLAPVPWFPSVNPRFARYAAFARAPRRERRHDIEILHPRYPLVPRIGMRIAPYLLYLGARRALRRMLASGYAFDLIDAHYFYPDGVAAVMLGRAFDRPVTITARGSDLNLIPDHALPRRMIRWAAREADGLITVSAALKRRLVDLDVDPARITVLRNGVDLATFHPIDQDAARARIGLDGRVLAMVGNLVPLKGHDLVIAALPELDGVSLVIAGDGPESTRLKSLAAGLGISDRVRFMGRIAHEALVDVYGAADALVLASSREGWPNVLLEAMACGTPVVATPVGGVGEIVTAPEAGILMTERSASAVADAVRTLFAALPTRAATRAYAMKFGWGETTEGQIALFRRILCRDAPRREDAGNGTLSSDAHLEDEPGNLSMTLPP